MRTRRLAFLAFLAVALAAVAPLPARAETDAERVAARLAGTWDSRDQAQRDPGLRQLRMIFAVVPRSRLGAGAPVLYFEEALLATPDQPLRQAFLRLEAEEGTERVLLKTFEPKEGASVSGKWRDPEDLALFGSSDVRERPGCTVALRPRNDWWEGSTIGMGCPFAREGARALTLEIALGAETLAWWERGLGADGRQVWGPPKAPLLSRRSKDPPVDPIATRTSPPVPSSLAQAPARMETRDLTPGGTSGGLVVRGLGPERRVSATEIGSGVRLMALLLKSGLEADGMPAQRLLAPAVVIATGGDGYAAVFALAELLDRTKGPQVVPDPGPQGPFKISSGSDRIRGVWNLVSLEVRFLATNRPEEDRTATPSASPRPPRS